MAKLRNMLAHLKDAAGDWIAGSAAGIGRADELPFEPLAAGGLIVRCHVRWPTNGELLRGWEALWARVIGATPFTSPAWQSAAWNTQNSGGSLRLLTVHRAEELVAVLPLVLNRDGGLFTPGAAVSDYLDPLVAPELEAECWRAILAFLGAMWDRSIVEVAIHNVRENATCRSILAAVAKGAGFLCQERITEHAPMILLPATWEEFLQTLDPHERKESRRKLKKAEDRGGARLVPCDRAEAIGHSLDSALRFMEAAGGEKGDAVKRFLHPLLLAAAPELIRAGRLKLSCLEILEKPACYLLQFQTPRGPLLYNCGFDAAKKQWSPGVVAMLMSIRDAIAAGAIEYDLLRGREPYKYKLGAMDRPLFRLTLTRSPGAGSSQNPDSSASRPGG